MPADSTTPVEDVSREKRGPLRALLNVRQDERAAVLWSILFSFFILASYYLLRPVREAIGSSDPDVLHKLWTGTFIVMLIAAPIYAEIASRFSRRRLIAVTYRFFALNMIVFFALVVFGPLEWRVALEHSFYVWLSVFNLFIIVSFWSFMADIFRNEQAKRLFGLIAFGGSLGAIAGSAAAAQIPKFAPPFAMLLLAALLLEAAVWMMRALDRSAMRKPMTDCGFDSAAASSPTIDHDAMTPRGTAVIGGNILTGIGVVFRSPYLLGICVYLLFYTTTASVLYIQQAHVVNAAVPERAAQTTLFANVNLAVNVIVLLMQLLLTGRIVRIIGVGWTLTILPILCAIGFLALGLSMRSLDQSSAPVGLILAVVIAFDVLRRIANYALAKPAREVLFTVVSREQKYQSKGFIDTVVYRGGDVAAAWGFAALQSINISLSIIALSAAPLSIIWAIVGLRLGRQQSKRAAHSNNHKCS